MFRLRELVTDRVDGIEEAREIKFDEKIEWHNARPPYKIEILCENKNAGISLEFNFNPLMSGSFFHS